MDALSLILVLVIVDILAQAISLGGHFWIAYRYGPDRGKEGAIEFVNSAEGGSAVGALITGFFASSDGAAMRAALVEEVLAASPPVPTIEEIRSNIPQVPTAADIASAVRSAFSGVAGAVEKQSVKDLAAIPLSTGNPMLDGAWALAPADLKRKAIRMLRSAAGAQLNGDAATDVTAAADTPDGWH
ncbi:MAG: hypothetical protein ACYDDA_13290 [Acidiferrobacteraceae bacterium]